MVTVRCQDVCVYVCMILALDHVPVLIRRQTIRSNQCVINICISNFVFNLVFIRGPVSSGWWFVCVYVCVVLL